jgi:hypothetical protein
VICDAKSSSGEWGSRRTSRLRGLALFLGLAAVTFVISVIPPLAVASKSVVEQIGGGTGDLGGEFGTAFVRGVAVNNATGDVYVVDNRNRIQRFGSSHDFISSWGFDVIREGEPGDLGSNVFEVCVVKEDCKAGINSVSPAPGGELSAPEGIAINQSTGNVYVHNAGFLRIDVFSASGIFLRTFGQDVVEAGKPGNADETQAVTVKATAGQFTLTFGADTTTDLPFNASAAEVQTALNALASVSAGGGSVTVSGGPGNETGISPYVATFGGGPLAGTDVAQMTAASGTTPLSGGSPSSGATVVTTNSGATGFEVCTVASDCKSGTTGGSAGAIGSPFTLGGVSTVPAGGTAPNPSNVLVADRTNRRVSEYTSAGAFVRSFGFDVVEAGPDNTGTTFEVCRAEVDACKAAAAGGAAVGQFGNNGPKRVVEDSAGRIYTAEYAAGNFRVQRFKLAGSEIVPEGVFAESLFTGTTEGTAVSDIALDDAGNLFGVKGYLAGERPYCLGSGAPSVLNDKRILAVNPAGTLLDTHLICAGITNARGLAFNSTSGRFYLPSTFPVNTAQVYVVDDVNPPTATIEPVTESDAFSATLKGEVNPQGSLTECRFDYIAKAAFEQNVSEAKEPFTGAPKVPCESSPGSGTGLIAVSAQIKGGLAPNTPYKVRLVAFKPPFGDIAAASSTEEFTSGAVPPPTVITGAAAPRGTTTARLNGLVNPNSSPTEVHFEYGTAGPCSANPCASTALQDVGSTYIVPGLPFTSVSAELEGLEPNTTYHYRLVGVNGIGASAGADRTFVTRSVEAVGGCPNEDVRQKQHSDTYLGHCRAIELVNTPDKGNQNLFAQIGGLANAMMTPDGETALWWVSGGAPGGTASAGNTFLAERTESGWQSRNLVPPPDQQFGDTDLSYQVEKATPSLDAFIFNAGSNALDEGRTPIRLDREQHQDVLASYENSINAEKSEITDDGVHVLVVNPDTKQLEDIGDGTPESISLMPGGSPSGCGLATTGESFAGWSGDGEAAGAHWNPGYRMMDAEDASRVYFEVRPDGDCGGLYGLYVRNRETDETTLIDPGAFGHHVEFIRAAPDGRSAYFATASQLDADDQNTGGDVYRWDEVTGESTCLTCVVTNANIDTFQNDFLPILISDDFSHIYFQSQAQLIPGHGQAGKLNTYVVSGGTIGFVAGEGVGRLGVSGGSAGSPTALLSPDGNVLVFASVATGGAENLTADELAEECTAAGGAIKPCQELYRYDDRDGSLECISCLQGDETTFSAFPGAQFRMSADGRTVAFVTFQPLVAHDVNQGVDVYEWRDGAVHLISDGMRTFPLGLTPPQVRGVDADGENILFALVAPGLTGFEQDGQRNLYNARIGGGFLPPSLPPHCAEDACQGPLAAAPALEKAASLNESRGNVVEPSRRPRPCAKKRGKAKRRCIRKHRRRAQRAKASGGVRRAK